MVEVPVRCSLRRRYTKGLYRDDPGYLYQPCATCKAGRRAGFIALANDEFPGDCDACDGEGRVKTLVTVHIGGRRVFPGSRGPRPRMFRHLQKIGRNLTILRRSGYSIFAIGRLRVLVRFSKRRRAVGNR